MIATISNYGGLANTFVLPQSFDCSNRVLEALLIETTRRMVAIVMFRATSSQAHFGAFRLKAKLKRQKIKMTVAISTYSS
jgi:hypothetical protein